MVRTADFLLGFSIAWRARFATVVFYLLILLVIASLAAVQFSARQLATVALDVGLSVMRLSLPVLAVLLVQELLTREFERKLYLTSLTYPRPRQHWLLGRVAAIVCMLVMVMLVMAALLALVVSYAGSTYAQATPVSLGGPYLITLAFLSIDIASTVAMATFLSVVATTPSFVLIGTLGFVLIARSYMSIVQMLADNRYLVDKLVDADVYKDSLYSLGYLLPDLGTLDVRMIALYDKYEFLPADWPILIGTTAAYVVGLLSLAAWRLGRRELA